MVRKIILFDLETTGLPLQPHYGKYYHYKKLKYYDGSRIIQFAFQIYEEQKNGEYLLTKEIDTIIKPDGFWIKNSYIHHITQEMAEQTGVDFKTAVNQIKDEFKSASLIIAHNVLFDTNVFLSELYRYGLHDIEKVFNNIPQFCTSRQTANIVRIKYNKTTYKPPKLIELYKWLFKKDVLKEGMHNALQDTKVLSECFFELLKRKHFHLN
jgi:DNA polymerase-3 subunit alpha